jgi:hypothetical protein
MHFALSRVRGGVEVLDLASTCGIDVDGEEKRHVLVKGSAALVLSDEDTVHVRVIA